MATCTVCGKPAGPLMSMCQSCIDESRARAGAPDSAQGQPIAAGSSARAQSDGGDALTSWGAVLLLGGLGLGGYSLLMDTTIASGQFGLDRVHNLGLLSTRVVLAIFAGFCFLAGVTLMAAAGVVRRLRRTP